MPLPKKAPTPGNSYNFPPGVYTALSAAPPPGVALSFYGGAGPNNLIQFESHAVVAGIDKSSPIVLVCEMRLPNTNSFAESTKETILVIVVFLTSLTVSVTAFFYEKQRNDLFAQEQFDQEIVIVESNLRQTFNAYAQVLRSGVSLFQATDHVDRAVWRDFIGNLDLEVNFPGILGISFNALLHSKAELDTYEALMQSTDLASFTIRPGGDQAHYVPIVYLEPSTDQNRGALGFDIYSEANRRAAIDRAFASNAPSMTSRITLVQDGDASSDGIKAGVLVILPILPEQLDPTRPNIDQSNGVIVSVFRIRDLMDATLRDETGQSTVQRKFVNLQEVTPDGEVLDLLLIDVPKDHDPKHHVQRTFELFGKTWRLTAHSSTVFEAGHRQIGHLTILFAGLLVTVLLTLTVAAQAARNRDSRASADALRKSNARIALLMKEINHRSKNLLSLVQAIARQTSAGNPEDFTQSFGRRLSSLSASQDLLVKNKWQDIELKDLLKAQLAHFKDLLDTRIVLSGPVTYLDAANAQTFSMAIHELATNATKYGALSNDTCARTDRKDLPHAVGRKGRTPGVRA